MQWDANGMNTLKPRNRDRGGGPQTLDNIIELNRSVTTPGAYQRRIFSKNCSPLTLRFPGVHDCNFTTNQYSAPLSPGITYLPACVALPSGPTLYAAGYKPKVQSEVPGRAAAEYGKRGGAVDQLTGRGRDH